jgi:hypothetical protein
MPPSADGMPPDRRLLLMSNALVDIAHRSITGSQCTTAVLTPVYLRSTKAPSVDGMLPTSLLLDKNINLNTTSK